MSASEVYRKPTQSNRYLSKNSSVPRQWILQWILSTLNTLRIRALRYCTSPQDLKEEFEFLSNVFINNHGYDAKLVRRFFSIDGVISTCKPSPPISLDQIIVPFFGEQAVRFRGFMASLNISVVFKQAISLRSILFKPSFDQSIVDPINVVYLVGCENCNGMGVRRKSPHL